MIKKFEKNGKKHIRFKYGDEWIEAELAPREVVERIAKENEVKADYSFTVAPQEADAGEKVTLQGWFEAPDKEGEYTVDITVSTQGYSYTIPNVAKFRVKKQEQVILTAQEVDQAIKTAFGDRAEKALWLNADAKYYAARLDDIRAVLQTTKIDKLPYIIEKDTGVEAYDCDDFSFALMGALHANPYKPQWMPTGKEAVFITWVWWKEGNNTYGHALNMCVTADKKVYMIEPQNYTIFNVPPNWNLILIIG